MTSRTLALLCLLLTPLLGLAQEKPRLDKHGFPLPEGAIARLGNLRFVCPEFVSAVALSQDGKLIAIGDDRILIWNADTAKIVREIKDSENGSVRALAWSKDGRLLASMNLKTAFVIWNISNGKPHWLDADKIRQCKGKYQHATALRFVASDQLLAIVTASKMASPKPEQDNPNEQAGIPNWRVELWNVDSGTLSSTWTVDEEKRAKLKTLGNGYEIHHVALSPSGDRMAWLATRPHDAQQANSTVFVYDTKSGELLHTVKNLPRTYRVDLPDEGQLLVVHPVRPAKLEKITSLKGTVVGIPDGKLRFNFDYRFLPPAYQNPYTRLRAGYVALGRSAVRFRDSLLTFDGVGMIRWSLKGTKQDEYNQRFTDFGVSANSKRLVVGEGYRLQLSAGDLVPLYKSTDYPYAPQLRFLPDGRLLGWASRYQTGSMGRHLHIWNPHKEAVLQSLWLHPWPAAADEAVRQDSWGKLVAYLTQKEGFAVHDLITNERLFLLSSLSTSEVREKGCVLLPSGDGKRLLLYAQEPEQVVVRWFDASKGEELGSYEIPYRELHPRALEAKWFSEDGSVFGYITSDHRLALVSCAERKVIAMVGMSPNKDSKYPFWWYKSVGFDRLLFALPDHATLHPEYALWNREGQILRRYALQYAKRDEMGATLLAHDGRVMAVSLPKKRTIIFYETATGRRRGQLKLPQDYHHISVDFSPDGKLLATSSDDTTILLWNLARPLSGKAELPPPKTMNEAEKLWDLLGDPDPQEADLSLWALVRAPAQTIPMMKKRLQPMPPLDAKQVRTWIAQLDSENFKVRETANQNLLRIGPSALPALRTALAKPASLEQHLRLEKLAAQLDIRIEVEPCLRELRALEVLERIGGDEARRLVARLAAGDEAALRTREARLILARWQETTAAK